MAQASAEKFEHTGPIEKERVASVPQRKQLAITPSHFCQKEKKRRHLSKASDHELGKSQDERVPYLGEIEGGLSRRMGGKDRFHRVGRHVPKL